MLHPRSYFMKLLILSVAIACQLSPLASRAVCQESRSQPERLHFAFSFPQGHKVLFELTATSAQRVLSSSVLQLTGNVEVRITTSPATGQIDAHGDVHTTFIELSPRGHRLQGYEPEPLQRPVLARAGSVATQ